MANELRIGSSTGLALAWPALMALLFIAGCHAEPAAKAAQCRAKFLSSDGAWEAREFDGEVLRPTSSELGTFTPIERIFVQAGKLYIQTWATEPVGADITATTAGINIRPLYMVWLGTDDDIGREAKKLVPYGSKSAQHILSIEGGCKEPSNLEVDIYLSPGQKKHKVLLQKVPTVHFEI